MSTVCTSIYHIEPLIGRNYNGMEHDGAQRVCRCQKQALIIIGLILYEHIVLKFCNVITVVVCTNLVLNFVQFDDFVSICYYQSLNQCNTKNILPAHLFVRNALTVSMFKYSESHSKLNVS